MALKKRSATKHDATRLSMSEDAIVEITNCAAGKGKIMRRLRPCSRHKVLEEAIDADSTQDNHSKTPSPKRANKLAGPPRIDRQPRREPRALQHSSDSLFFNKSGQQVEDIVETSRQNSSRLFEEFRKYVPEERNSPRATVATAKAHNVLGSPFREALLPLPPPSPPGPNAVRFPPTVVEDGVHFESETQRPSDHSNPCYSLSRHQTVLVDSEHRFTARRGY